MDYNYLCVYKTKGVTYVEKSFDLSFADSLFTICTGIDSFATAVLKQNTFFEFRNSQVEIYIENKKPADSNTGLTNK